MFTIRNRRKDWMIHIKEKRKENGYRRGRKTTVKETIRGKCGRRNKESGRETKGLED